MGSAWDVTVLLHTDQRLPLPPFANLRGGQVQQIVIPRALLPGADINEMLYEHRKVMRQNLSAYDVFIFSENDMVITPENVSCVLS
jgi:hypothetical protein